MKEGNVHISAPHIYGSALEALELIPGSSLSFLNIGSGTGYLSCIVAHILGPKSLNFGVEIHKDVVEHSKIAIHNLKNLKAPEAVPHLEIVHGNALQISCESGESMIGFDRIYIGASVDKFNLPKITKLLSPGGILVGPVDDELIKIKRIGCKDNSDVALSEINEFSQQVLSGVRFAPLATTPKINTILPARIWSHKIQEYYPNSFQQAIVNVLMCSNSSHKQLAPRSKPLKECINVATLLPRALWFEIFSYTHRKWFISRKYEEEFLQRLLQEERRNTAREQKIRIDAEARCKVAEKERDVYLMLARHWQSRLQLLLQQQRSPTGSGVILNYPIEAGNGIFASDGDVQQIINNVEIASVLDFRHEDNQNADEDLEFFFSANNSTMEEEETDGVIIDSEMLLNDGQFMELLEKDDSDEESEFSVGEEQYEESSIMTENTHEDDYEEGDERASIIISKSNANEVRAMSIGNGDF